MLIRPAILSNLESVWRLERAVFGSDAYPRFFFRQAFDLWNELLLIAEAPTGEVVGYILGAPSLRPGEGWILSVAVDPDYRGRRAGGRLTERLLQAFAARGAGEVRITVHPDNEAAVRLYQGLGFEPIASEDSYFGPDEPRLLMARQLASGL